MVERRDMKYTVCLPDTDLQGHVQSGPDDTVMIQDHPFGPASGSRGIEDLCIIILAHQDAWDLVTLASGQGGQIVPTCN